MSCLQVHRLDAGTGGLVLIAKTRAAVAALGTDLAAHNMQKRLVVSSARQISEGILCTQLAQRIASVAGTRTALHSL